MQGYHHHENSSAVSLVGLGLVVISIPLTMWWWSGAVWGDFSLSFLSSVAAYIGYTNEPERPLVGSQPTDAPAEQSSVATQVSGAAQPTAAISMPPAAAPHCASEQVPRFILGFARLKQRLGQTMGEALECEHPNPANGDTLQQTTTGLAVFRRASGELQFTDGWRHWALTGNNLIIWDGQDQAPAEQTAMPEPALDRAAIAQLADQPMPAAARFGMRTVGRIVNTDDQGVVLRSAPRPDARTPRGLLEGAEVEVLDRSGTDWVRVRGVDTGTEGWILTQYLQVQQS
jgi:hypothetical protein